MYRIERQWIGFFFVAFLKMFCILNRVANRIDLIRLFAKLGTICTDQRVFCWFIDASRAANSHCCDKYAISLINVIRMLSNSTQSIVSWLTRILRKVYETFENYVNLPLKQTPRLQNNLLKPQCTACKSGISCSPKDNFILTLTVMIYKKMLMHFPWWKHFFQSNRPSRKNVLLKII